MKKGNKETVEGSICLRMARFAEGIRHVIRPQILKRTRNLEDFDGNDMKAWVLKILL